jgi:hypothetical protein
MASPIASNLVLAAGNGIDFSAASGSAAGSSSAVLDDYEEGTWAGVISGATIDNSFSTYTKIGRTVAVFSHITLAGGTMPPDTFSITGLPFSSDSSFRGSVSITVQDATSGYAQVSGPTAILSNSSSEIQVDLHGFAISTSDRINLTCVYNT